jgi:hypothetical protein
MCFLYSIWSSNSNSNWGDILRRKSLKNAKIEKLKQKKLKMNKLKNQKASIRQDVEKFTYNKIFLF